MNVTAPPIPKILVVDDTPANLLVMRKLLAKLDVDLIEAASGEEALSACIDHQFALILLDVNMPGLDGFEVAALLQAEISTRQTPIIFVTAAYGDDLNRLKGYDSGAVDYIAKPINHRILLSKVRIFLELYRSKLELQTALEQLFDRNRELMDAQEQMRHLAHHDALTGLPNRVLFMDRLDSALQRALRQPSSFAVLYIDIDGFKPVNDRHGHSAGDELLSQIAERLQHLLRRSDTVARLGGDEFAMIIEQQADAAGVQHIGEKICLELQRPFVLDSAAGVEVKVGSSVGMALYPLHGETCDALIHAADAAMYRVKRGGKNACAMAKLI